MNINEYGKELHPAQDYDLLPQGDGDCVQRTPGFASLASGTKDRQR